MGLVPFNVLDRDIWRKEGIYWRCPGLLELICILQ